METKTMLYRLLSNLFAILIVVGASTAVAANKTITIKGYADEAGDTIALPEGAELGLTVNADGIVVELPSMDVRVRCLGEATADGYCYLSAASAGAGTDSDGDGVPDVNDACPSSGSSGFVNSSGCASSQLDSDNDGVANGADQCPGTAAGAAVDASGCSDAQNFRDADGDGVADATDQCPSTPAGQSVNSIGCSASQLDSDGDGVSDASDSCPNTPSGTSVDANGCEVTSNNGSYCSGTGSTTSCSATRNFDPWWDTVGEKGYSIPTSRVLSIPFTTRESSVDGGTLQYTTNQIESGYIWRFWFSETPAGTPLKSGGKCDVSLSQARTSAIWTQNPKYATDSGACFLGTAKRTLYLNYSISSGAALLPKPYYFDISRGYRQF